MNLKIASIYSIYKKSSGISIDSRSLKKNQLFFAIKGDNFDGNTYANTAIEKGAIKAIIDNPKYHNSNTILVENSLNCLQELATYHREKLSIPIIAITGSNGKTTTKELIFAALSQQYNTFATKGNLNNHIGVPISLLSITANHDIAIIEMGANHLLEIKSYCSWCKPSHGLITNIGKAHLEGFGSIEGVVKGKTELYTALSEMNGLAFYNLDDTILKNKSRMVDNRKSYGEHEHADYPFKINTSKQFIQVHFSQNNIQSKLIGTYNGVNIGAAIAVAKHFDIPNNKIKKGIESYYPSNNRSQVLNQNTNKIILDAYNANPTSMKAALDSFNNIEGANKMVILGDMYEVGDTSLKEHKEIANYALSLPFEKIVLVGNQFYNTSTKKALKFKTTKEAKQWYQNSKFKNYTILVKGSRGMKLENIIETQNN